MLLAGAGRQIDPLVPVPVEISEDQVERAVSVLFPTLVYRRDVQALRRLLCERTGAGGAQAPLQPGPITAISAESRKDEASVELTAALPRVPQQAQRQGGLAGILENAHIVGNPECSALRQG